jgi:cytochrome c oxidase subunit I+III
MIATQPEPHVPREHEESHRRLERTWTRGKGLVGFFTTTNHKDISIRYIVTAFFFFALAGILAALMRIQLSRPENHFLNADLYNQIFTVHGTTMMFLFAVPIMEGMGLYFVPLMLGTRNVAFPRMNSFGYYCFLFGGILLYAGLFLRIGPDAGWFAYTPLSGPQFSPGKRVDFWAQMITLTEIAALVGAVEIIVTVFKQRAPGMSINRLPVFVWAMVVTSFMIIFAMPSVMLASGMLAMDRLSHVNTHFFNAAEGGDNLLYQHLFWFFGHPEVYIIFIPATGFVSEIISTFSRRRIFGYTAIVLSLVATGFIGFGLWVHHMFATPIPELGQAFFTGSSMLIAIPSGIQIFCWIATLWTGRPQLRTPLLFVLGFIAIFVMGGLTGITLASVSLDLQVHDTYYVVAHFHYVLIGGAVFPLFGAIYYWFPKWTGKLMNESLGKLNFWLFFIGFNLTFFPMHILGLRGMPRRVYTYMADTGWGNLNLLASIGAAVITTSVVVFLINVFTSRRNGIKAGPNPWNGSSLEWAVPSPVPAYSFLFLPTVRGRNALWDDFENTSLVTGISEEKREVVNVTLLDGQPQHKFELAGDSLWPLLLAFVVFGAFAACIFTPWAIPIGAFGSLVIFSFWFWRGSEPKSITEEAEKTPEPSRSRVDLLHQRTALDSIRRRINLAHLEQDTLDHRSPIWWGNLLLLFIETTMFGILIASYLYYRNIDFQVFPPPSVEKYPPIYHPVPDLGLPTWNLALLLFSVLPMAWTDWACLKRKVLSVKIGLTITILCGIAAAVLRFYEFPCLKFRWDTNAYASVIWLILGMHLAHIITATCENGLMASWLFTKGLDDKHARDIRVTAVYWYWVVGTWIVLYGLVYWGPRLL